MKICTVVKNYDLFIAKVILKFRLIVGMLLNTIMKILKKVFLVLQSFLSWNATSNSKLVHSVNRAKNPFTFCTNCTPITSKPPKNPSKILTIITLSYLWNKLYFYIALWSANWFVFLLFNARIFTDVCFQWIIRFLLWIKIQLKSIICHNFRLCHDKIYAAKIAFPKYWLLVLSLVY